MGKKQFQPEAEKSLSEILQIRGTSWLICRKTAATLYNHQIRTSPTAMPDVTDRFDELEGQTVSVAGRLVLSGAWARSASATCRTSPAGYSSTSAGT